jgi:2-polyprenyl-6-methoxyphenol hydroxylase-like FAD-dependent oxidoreductase
MRNTDIAIVGGGLAGSAAAAMLGRAGIDAVLIDPHRIHPNDFRCEKLDASQVLLLCKTGLAEAVLRAATPDLELSIVRLGRLVETRPNRQNGILYDDLVNTVRAQIPTSVAFIQAKARGISTGPERQRLTLSTGESVCARLVVLASGLNTGLRESLGVGREVRSQCHSISIGFDLRPIGRAGFDFRALTYFPERASDRMAYLTLFPIGGTMRANLFVYRDRDDPWLQRMRRGEAEAVFELMPRLRELTGEVALDAVRIRPVDLHVSTGYLQPGVALVGDAFSTSCPAAGTGCNKVLTDVERPLQPAHSALAGEPGNGGRQDRRLLPRPGPGGMREGQQREGLLPALALDRDRAVLAGAAPEPAGRPGRHRRAAPGAAQAHGAPAAEITRRASPVA